VSEGGHRPIKKESLKLREKISGNPTAEKRNKIHEEMPVRRLMGGPHKRCRGEAPKRRQRGRGGQAPDKQGSNVGVLI